LSAARTRHGLDRRRGAELRDPAIPYGLPVIPGARDLRDRPELVAIAGVTLALVAAAFGQLELVYAGGAVGLVGLLLYAIACCKGSSLVCAQRGVEKEAFASSSSPLPSAARN
jgi:hypothetical protein